MNALQRKTGVGGCRRLSRGLAALALAWGGSAFAQDVVTVPAAHLHYAEGSLAYAPQGDKEWHDVQPRRLLKRGDRLWTDRGSRAEVQAGGHAVRLNGETQMVLENVGDTATQISVTQGSVAATVTHMNPGDSFEIGTPNLAFRARQPGDYRIDVDAKQGMTRIAVQSGSAVVYGEKGEALEVKTGQRVTFKDRNLSRGPQVAFAATDDFDKWAGARRRGEPTVSMPAVAQASTPAAPLPAFVNKGKDIVISGPASSLPGARSQAAAAAAQPTVQQASAKALPPASPPPMVAKAQPLPTVPVVPNTPAAVPMRVTAPGTAVASAVPSVSAKAEAEARVRAQAEAAVQAAREQQERERVAQQRAEEERRAAAAAEAKRAENERRAAAAEAKRAEGERRAAAAAEAKRAEAKRAEEERRAEARRAEAERRADAKRSDDKRRAVAAKQRAEEERRAAAQARREQEQKRIAAAKRAEEERRAQAKRAAEEKKLAAARKAEEQKIAQLRKQQLARLQDQARRDEQKVQARREEDRRAADERREEQARREEQYRREEQARRDEDLRRQRALAEQARREQERRDEEVWLRQQQYAPQPARPAPMGVPARRVS